MLQEVVRYHACGAYSGCDRVVRGHKRGSTQPHNLNQSVHLLQPVPLFKEAQYPACPENTQRPSGGSGENMDDAIRALEAQQIPVLKPGEARYRKSIATSNLVFRFLPTRLRRAATERCPRASHRPGSKGQIPEAHDQVQWAFVRRPLNRHERHLAGPPQHENGPAGQ